MKKKQRFDSFGNVLPKRRFIKVLSVGKDGFGHSCHGGSMRWPLPLKGMPLPKPKTTKTAAMCFSGLHFTTDDPKHYSRWLTNCDLRMFVCETGPVVQWDDATGKGVTRKIQLIKEYIPRWLRIYRSLKKKEDSFKGKSKKSKRIIDITHPVSKNVKAYALHDVGFFGMLGVKNADGTRMSKSRAGLAFFFRDRMRNNPLLYFVFLKLGFRFVRDSWGNQWGDKSIADAVLLYVNAAIDGRAPVLFIYHEGRWYVRVVN
jgi:hypothetical protein